MSGLRDIAKGGWHPKGKDGKTESWRGDYKGINQVAGWMGKGKDPNASTAAQEHVSRPLQSLKDPSEFGPPPKNVNYYGGAASPSTTASDSRAFSSADSRAQRQPEEVAKPAPPPVPFRVDTTGLSTNHLPPPPGRKDGADGRSPISASPTTGAKSKPPSLPPRLPPRQTAAPPPPAYSEEPDAHKGILNQASLSRLGNAGVSVPGFGIGKQAPPSSPATNNSAPVNELQSRFSRLSSSKTDAPATGTTFAEKQAALRVASSVKKDPSSVSLSDARSAASVANNFRARHGDQVKSGWQSANKLNAKYGVSEKVGSFTGDPSTEQPVTANMGICMQDNTQDQQESKFLEKKKPPPPPPMKKAVLASGSAPPPIPMSSKPKPKTAYLKKATNSISQDYDLDLHSLWFAKSPPEFPPNSINRLPGKRIYSSSSSWSSSGVRKSHTFIGAIRDSSTLATTIIRLTWDGSNPGHTVRSEQKHLPPPRDLTRQELELYRDQYSDDVASWCEAQMGKQVGNGECWTLANEGLKAVAAQKLSRSQEPCMSSQSYVHGYQIYSFIPAKSPYPEPPGGTVAAGVARGDVVQFYEARFEAKNGGWSTAGAPDHTAVVTHVEPDGVLRVVESNSGGVKTVRKGSYNMAELVKGEVRVFRAVGESWAGKLEARW